MNSRQAYALRAYAVYVMRWMGFTIADLAVILRVSKEQIRQLEARGRRAFRKP